MKNFILLIGVIFTMIACNAKKTEKKNDNALDEYIKSGKFDQDMAKDQNENTKSLSSEIEKNYFLNNLYFAMTKSEFTDSIYQFPNYENENFIMKFDSSELLFHLMPTFKDGYLQSVNLTSVPKEISISKKLNDDFGDNILYEKPLFYIQYLEANCLKDIIDLYTTKYGQPAIKKSKTFTTALNPDISKFVDEITMFNRSSKSDLQNKLDSTRVYQKFLTNINESFTIDTFEFKSSANNIVRILTKQRSNISRLKFTISSFKSLKLAQIEINYLPKELLEINENRKVQEKSFEKLQIERKNELDKSLKQATKKVI